MPKTIMSSDPWFRLDDFRRQVAEASDSLKETQQKNLELNQKNFEDTALADFLQTYQKSGNNIYNSDVLGKMGLVGMTRHAPIVQALVQTKQIQETKADEEAIKGISSQLAQDLQDKDFKGQAEEVVNAIPKYLQHGRVGLETIGTLDKILSPLLHGMMTPEERQQMNFDFSQKKLELGKQQDAEKELRLAKSEAEGYKKEAQDVARRIGYGASESASPTFPGIKDKMKDINLMQEISNLQKESKDRLEPAQGKYSQSYKKYETLRDLYKQKYNTLPKGIEDSGKDTKTFFNDRK